MPQKELRATVAADFAAYGQNSVAGDLEKHLPLFGKASGPCFEPDLRPIEARREWSFSSPDKHGLSVVTATKIASLVSWLFVHRPIGCPVRAGIVDVVTKLRGVIANPRMVWEVNSKGHDEEPPKKRAARHDAVSAFVGGKPVEPTNAKGREWSSGRDDGTLILVPRSHDDGPTSGVYGLVRTAKLTRESLERIEQFSVLVSGWKDQWIGVAALIGSDEFAAFGSRVAKTPVPAGGYEATPLASVPALVAEVAKREGVSTDAAALYLQTLAIAEPTEGNVLAWNGWTIETYRAAAAELVAKKLVVAGKHPKANRTIFLPGKVTKLKERKVTKPRRAIINRPFEVWKEPLYPALPFEKHLATEPCHLLFARAWKRIVDGDRP